MSEVVLIILLTLSAGLAMPVGAAFAHFDELHPSWLNAEARHAIVAFGGGALFSAVSLVLVPEGSEALPVWLTAVCFSAGGLAFFALDRLLASLNTPASQLAAMLSDFIPEAIALGAAFAMGNNSGVLLALLIALQNMPEGFNAYRELMRAGRYGPLKIIIAFTLMAMLGPVVGVSGYEWLADFPQFIAGLMLFASGGILYVVFQDIAPQAKLNNAWAPSLGAVAGFLLGLIGNQLI